MMALSPSPGPRTQEATAIRKGALAQDVRVPGFAHHLAHQERLDFVVLGVDFGQPHAGSISSDELHLR
jgi:hypothetical protein